MKKIRRNFSVDVKAKVALEAINHHKTLAQLSEHFEVNPIHFQLEGRVIGEFGQLKVELDFLKKVQGHWEYLGAS